MRRRFLTKNAGRKSVTDFPASICLGVWETEKGLLPDPRSPEEASRDLSNNLACVSGHLGDRVTQLKSQDLWLTNYSGGRPNKIFTS